MTDVVEGAFRRHYRDVYRFVRRRGVPHERAEELAQDVFADAAAALARQTETTPTLAWLYTVAHRRFVDEARRRSRRPDAATVRETSVEYGPPITAAVRAAFARLPDGQREVVTLKLLRGLRFAEIASHLGTSEAAAKMRFSRALAALRDELTKEGVEP